MSRMETLSLTRLIEAREAAGYTLPDELLSAWRVYTRAKDLTVPEAPVPNADAAVGRILAQLANAEDVDPLAHGRDLANTEADRKAHAEAQRLVSLAADEAANAAANICSDLAEQIITGHLRPALDDVHAQAREVADALTGYGLDPHRLITAPAKARNAYAKLPELVARNAAIWEARKYVNAIGHRTVQHDRANIFATFANPQHFHPTWSPNGTAAMPKPPTPQDPTERLLWIASDEAAPARPWLPTCAEQDQAHQAVYGETENKRRNAAVLAKQVAGRAPMPVRG